MNAHAPNAHSVLLSILHDGGQRMTVQEMISATGAHDRTVYYYTADEERKINADWLCKLSRYIASERGDTRLAQWMLGTGWAIIPTDIDGASIPDEIIRIVEHAGSIVDAARREDASAIQRHAQSIICEAAGIRAHADK